MWHRIATRPISCMAFSTLPWERWGVNGQRRCKVTWSATGSRPHNNLRAGTVGSTPFRVKPKINVPLWQPSAKYMKYKPIRWLSNNLLAIATYQMALEVGFTIIFGSLLYTENVTAQGVCNRLAVHHYPFIDWIDVEGGVYTQSVNIGPFTLNAQKMTALHTGHNIANGLLPLQVLLLATTFVPVQRAYRLLRRASLATVGASHAASGAEGAKVTAAGSMTRAQPPTPAPAGTRRASYTRATTARKPLSTSPLDQGNRKE
ncbi:hypothetical protein JKF63_05004 [Porcisia hertigi]|uniref:Uncharacterized protein n=1 Tax=Porcisia hertigi TaxID=2761500 RepID=A0A836LBE2_9TRYP|nr:hypothetical protein JKF63_05004 [Porcisia hertigi]